MYYCIKNIVPEVRLRYSWEGQSPQHIPSPNENYENFKLINNVIFKATRCIITQITMHFLEGNKEVS